MEVFKTDIFDKWFKKLKDKQVKAIIQVNINRLIEENIGNARSLGEGVHEKKINFGPGYRLYFINYKKNLIILLCAGEKSTQKNDIQQAKVMSQEVKQQLKGTK